MLRAFGQKRFSRLFRNLHISEHHKACNVQVFIDWINRKVPFTACNRHMVILYFTQNNQPFFYTLQRVIRSNFQKCHQPGGHAIERSPQ